MSRFFPYALSIIGLWLFARTETVETRLPKLKSPPNPAGRRFALVGKAPPPLLAYRTNVSFGKANV